MSHWHYGREPSLPPGVGQLSGRPHLPPLAPGPPGAPREKLHTLVSGRLGNLPMFWLLPGPLLPPLASPLIRSSRSSSRISPVFGNNLALTPTGPSVITMRRSSSLEPSRPGNFPLAPATTVEPVTSIGYCVMLRAKWRTSSPQWASRIWALPSAPLRRRGTFLRTIWNQ